MALSRAQYVAVCETCTHHKSDFKKGIICSLSGEYANFETNCPSYEKDAQAVRHVERMQKHMQEESPAFATDAKSNANDVKGVFTTEQKMLNSGMIGGILMIVGGVVWIVAGLAVNRIFFYPIFLIIAGIIATVKGAAKKAKEMQKPDTSHILDDKNDLEVL